MSAIIWDEQLPSDASSAASADDEFRSTLTDISVGLGEAMHWEGSAASQGLSAASSGELLVGTARAAVGASAPTGGHPDGFLALAADDEAVWHSGSAYTDIVGHGRMQDRAGGIGNAPFTTRWLIQTGTFTSSDRTDEVTFTTPYNGVPNVMLGPGAQAREYEFGLKTVLPSGFTTNKVYGGSGASASATFFWRSEGTVNI